MKGILKYSFLLLAMMFCVGMSGQNAKLAERYYKNGEYEKAAEMYQDIYKKSKENAYYFTRWMNSLIQLEDYSLAEKELLKKLKKNPKEVNHYLTLGRLYEMQGNEKKSEEYYSLAIKKLPASKSEIQKIASGFIKRGEYDRAAIVYEKGGELLKDDGIFAYSLGDLYRRKGETSKMIEAFLLAIEKQPKRMSNVQNQFDRYLTDEAMDTLKIILYERLQTSDNTELIELLAWTFIQQKNYAGALRQYKALDRKLEENGSRIFNLGQVAANDDDFDTAIEAFSYLVGLGSDAAVYYLDAKRELLNAKRDRLIQDFDYTQEELIGLEKEYIDFLDEFGWNSESAMIIQELADLEAFFLNDRITAIDYLEKLVAFRSLNKYTKARAKISLANFYLMEQEIWESTLLYSQVDKEFKEEILGQEARFLNAKLSYYNGNFEWAQTQFDVLKASTSRMISNDAIDLSVFITDNLGLDTTAGPMEMYAKADLLIFQNRFDEAHATLDSIVTFYPKHKLEDDIYFSKARIHEKKKEYELAMKLYERIVADFPDEIRSDNSLFRLAELHETYKKDTEKAKELYERLFLEYTDSTYAIEARKKYRFLRGDSL